MSGEAIVNDIVNYLDRQPEVLAAYVFGSLARGRFRADSDVDVAVLLAPTVGDKLARFEKRLELEIALEQQVLRTVQVVDLELAPPLLQHQIRKYGILIIEKDRSRRIDQEVAARRLFLDMQPVHKQRSAAVFNRLGGS
ncbi:MAG: type VII toxin-antitoxin system MntA family adenylyltransferase antitoxin [Candidatus Desulforudaceae bacterium]|nr:nucleotidyltransferase domain-containing protein [Bacillota bacterium]MBV1726586.1 nucleotidyltransferase domain-containing protein [Desulforudis sp.]MBU4533598.1 nucleotidyltransferase domain-containing protein [Bacillota bacterium]MBU4553710.1 nucleotidyltransferase domain-containing protein [Bacillota bacterium]MBV1734587.1 nucleotidyltransferase domain-containing protein [Desulforudis sp.]